MTLSEEEIFTAAVALLLSERASYLDGACAGSAALRSQVDALLAAHDQPDSLLASPAFDMTVATAVDADGPGAQIGPYKLLEQIGEGGMGIVYMAQQTHPVKRRVALKLIKPGMDSRQVIARFEAERQALAMMDHPNIARILDAGVVGEAIGNRGSGIGKTEGHRGDAPPIPDSRSLMPSTRPYFVMELVRGLPITDYCDREKLDIRRRLELFIDVCRAVQHAHLKGIIHRDIKPGNVLVTLHDGVPVVKVIDFGVAKALNQELTERTLFTQFTQMIGTPLYMSPEQAELSGLDIDTRSDIYSLGVLLYELLTGTTPFDRDSFIKAGVDEMRRMIREDEPPRPSTRISTLQAAGQSTTAPARSADPRKLSQHLRGELDWVVMKALEKDRNRRYQTASALTADVESYLADEPVKACPPSTVYRISKWSRRHKAALAAALTLLLAVVSVTALAWVGYQREGALRRFAETRRNEAQISLAKEAEARSTALRQKSEADRQRNAALQNLYNADMRLAVDDLNSGNLARIREALIKHLPNDGSPDLRDWEWYYLFGLCHQDSSETVVEQRNNVNFVAWSPDGRFLASCDASGLTVIWQRTDDEPRQGLPVDATSGEKTDNRRAQGVWRIARKLPTFSTGELVWRPDGRCLAGGTGHQFSIWDCETGAIESLVDHQGAWRSAAWSPAGNTLATSGGGSVRIWDIDSGTCTKILPRFSASRLAWDAEGKRIALAGRRNETLEQNCYLRIWTPRTNQFQETHLGSQGDCRAVAWSRDGQQLAVGGGDGSIFLVDGKSYALVEMNRGSHASGISDLEWNWDGSLLASAGVDRDVKLWNAQLNCIKVCRGHEGAVSSISWSPDGTQIASSGQTDCSVKIWQLPEQLSGQISLALHYFGTGNRCRGARMLPAELGLSVQRNDAVTHCTECHSAPGPWERLLSSIVVPPAAGHLEKSSPESAALFQSAGDESSLGISEMPYARIATADAQNVLTIHRNNLEQSVWRDRILPTGVGCGLNPDGCTLAYVVKRGNQGMVQIAELQPAKPPLQRTFPTALSSGQATWSPDGSLLAVHDDKNLQVYDLRNDEQFVKWQNRFGANSVTSPRSLTATNLKGEFGTGISHDAPMWLAWSPDSRLIATGRRIIDPTGNAPEVRLTYDGPSNCLAWQPDSRRLAAGGLDGRLRIWDTASGKLLMTSQFSQHPISCLEWNPAGTRIAVAVKGRGVRICDPATCEELLALSDDRRTVLALSWNSDGTTLTGVKADGGICRWEAVEGYRLATSDAREAEVHNRAHEYPR